MHRRNWHWHRHPHPRWIWPDWGGGYADVPPLDFRPEGFTLPARAELARLGLLTGIWANRVESGGPVLAAFVNRFYRSAGFEHVVRSYFGGPLLRRTARLAMRLAFRLAAGKAGTWRLIRFELLYRPAVGGGQVPGLSLLHGSRRYLLLPWKRLDPVTVRRQHRRNLRMYGSGAPIRWVLDRRRLPGSSMGSAARIQSMLGQLPGAASVQVLLR